MYFKSTLTHLKRACSLKSLAVAMFALCTVLANAQTYTNGNLSTGPNLTGGGTAAPAGTNWSQLQGANTSFGFGANIAAGITLADNFVVPAGPNWTVNKATFFAYSTGFAGTTSPYNDVRVLIYNTDPAVGNPTPIFGDFTTNRFLASSSANLYRTGATAGLTRSIWRIEANVAVSLAPGSYWIEWQLGNGGISNFSPPNTVVGVQTPPGGNSKQRTIAGNTWVNIIDAGGGGAQDQHFIIDYTTGACSGTPNPGNTIASVTAVCPTNPVTLSLQNATPGAGVTYQWQSGPSATGPWTNISGATNSSYSTSTLAATTFFRATVTCSGNTGTSTAVQVALNPPSACYCIPGNSDCTDGDIITNVTLGTLSNTSTCGTNGYTNYTANPAITIPTIVQGAGNPIRITAGTGTFTQSVAVWIDYDKSGTFDASEFTFIGTAATPTVRNGIINIPATAQLGQTRMRVRTRFNTALAAGNACLTYTFGETEDYNVNIVPCVPVALTSQPANASVTCANNTSFSVTASGSIPSFFWQYRVTPTSPWLNVPNAAPYSGVTTSTLTLTAATDNLNGYQYRAVFQGGCTGVDFSMPATLTVNRLVPVVNPAAPGICLGTVQPLSLTNSVAAEVTSTFGTTGLPSIIPDNDLANPMDKVIAVSGIPAGSIIKNVRVRMNINHTWVGDVIANLRAPNGQTLSLFAFLNGATGGNGTANFTNTIIDSLSTTPISGAAAPRTGSYAAERYNITAPATIVTTTPFWSSLLTTMNGNWTVRFVDGGAGDVGTITALELIIVYTAPGLAEGVWTGPAGTIFTDAAGTTPYTGAPATTVYVNPGVTGLTNYNVSFATPLCQSATTTVPVTVRSLPTSTTAIANRSICINGSTSFTSTPAGGAGFGTQWQVSTDGGTTFTNIANGGVYSGATTNTLSLASVPASFNGNRYRLSATAAPCVGSVNSTVATLTVNPTPVVVISANPFMALYPGQTTTLSAAVSPNPGATFTWFRNGVAVAGATGNTLVVDVDGLGVYTASVTDVNGCSGTSTAAIEIKDAANDILFIYPSPNSGQFQVRFFSGAGNNPLPRIINIYDNKGSRIYTRSYTIAMPYTRMDVNLKNHGKGIYNVELTDGNGRRLKTGRVVIN